MEMIPMKKLLFLFSMLLMFSVSAFAVNINMFEKPDASSKVVATLQNGDTVISIFAPEKSEWVKVGNTKNGDVGWVKIKELQGPVFISNINGKTIEQHIISDNKKPEEEKIIQYSGSVQLNKADVDKFTKQLEEKQKQMAESMNKMEQEMQKMFKDLSQDFPLPVVNLSVENKTKK